MSLMNKKFSCRQALILICFLLVLHVSHSKVSVNPRDRSNGSIQRSMDDKLSGKSSFKSIQSSLAITSSSPPTSSIKSSRSREDRRSEVLILLLPWLYFMAISINIPNLPKFVNWSINSGNTNVSPKSAAVYGTISGVDSFFTFLVVNVVGCMSDSFGRRPFMFLSSLGLGFAYFLTLSAKTPGMFYFAAMIDGLTSCMFSQAQCYVTDMNNRRESADKESVSVALGRFQGIAVGMAFLVGIPLGAVLGSKYSLTTPLYLAVILCSINAILIAFFLPEKKNFEVDVERTEKNTTTTTTTTPTPTNKNKNKDRNIVQAYVHNFKRKMKRVKWENASPIGAVRLLTRKKRLVAGSMAYFFLNVAQVERGWILLSCDLFCHHPLHLLMISHFLFYLRLL
jgi:MFS family permease